MTRGALVLDLDYTLLHLEPVSEAIEIPGRTRSAFLAAETAQALFELQGRYDIVLSTARSWHGTRPVVDGLADRGVAVSSVVLEDGALLGPPGDALPLEPERDWGLFRSSLDGALCQSPPFAWQADFEACLVARAGTPEEAESLLIRLGEEARMLHPGVRTFRDGRKVYVTGAQADKWTALVELLGPERARNVVGIGDGANDLCWLSEVSVPLTLAGAAPEVVALVRERSGFVSARAGHTGIADLLQGLSGNA